MVCIPRADALLYIGVGIAFLGLLEYLFNSLKEKEKNRSKQLAYNIQVKAFALAGRVLLAYGAVFLAIRIC